LIFRDTAPYAMSYIFHWQRRVLDTAASRLLAIWWNIPLGPRTSFYGLPRFRKHPTASITIAAGCTFRSAGWSNPAGIDRRCFISVGRAGSVKIGRDCGFSGTVISASKEIRIGDRVLFGANCTLMDTDHHPLDAADRARGVESGAVAIDIGDDVWLGMNVVVLKGVRIGNRTVVAANSIVTRSLPSGVLAGGVPARQIKSIAGIMPEESPYTVSNVK
jgi:acetyltransferase-like isoleucine patch superfamily enzyme